MFHDLVLKLTIKSDCSSISIYLFLISSLIKFSSYQFICYIKLLKKSTHRVQLRVGVCPNDFKKSGPKLTKLSVLWGSGDVYRTQPHFYFIKKLFSQLEYVTFPSQKSNLSTRTTLASGFISMTLGHSLFTYHLEHIVSA